MRRVLFRADGSTQIGLGHIVRSLALVEMLKDEFECVFITKAPQQKIIELIKEYCELVQLPASNSRYDEITAVKQLIRKNDILVLDFYEFDETYQLELKPQVCAMVAIDDMAAIEFHTDLVINHGSAGREHEYKLGPRSRLLSGFPYLLLRKPFRDAAKREYSVTHINSLFICMGGADPFNVTIKAVEAAIACKFLENIIVVTGSAYANGEALKLLVHQHAARVNHAHNIDAREMVRHISKCQVAICPASSISLEVCSVRAGLITGTVIDNQYGLHAQLTLAGCALSAGDLNTITGAELSRLISNFDVAAINEIILNQVTMIDGLSGERLVNEFKMLPQC